MVIIPDAAIQGRAKKRDLMRLHETVIIFSGLFVISL